MIDASRHVALRPIPWDADAATAAIDDIVRDAVAGFDPERFWPGHPLDEVDDGQSSVYLGAAGIIWAIDYLHRVGATAVPFDAHASLGPLLEKTQAEMNEYGNYSELGSFLLGDLGTALVVMRIAPSAATAELIERRVGANMSLPVRELMWGLPGSMLACVIMDELTGEPKWRAMFEPQAARLLGDLATREGIPVWVQDLYGGHKPYLGAVHGYAGNMVPLLRGWQWLSEAQRALVAETAAHTLGATAQRSERGASWPAVLGDADRDELCQHCHGSPGMVTSLADAPFTTPEFERLLHEGGEFTWATGPLAKGSNLCHGTGGNGYAFLKLFARTENPIWLERARAFAMTAIAQCREAREQYGGGRYSLWTGDIGLAVYLWDCLAARPRFPTIDVF